MPSPYEPKGPQGLGARRSRDARFITSLNGKSRRPTSPFLFLACPGSFPDRSPIATTLMDCLENELPG
jgi:hypothetical protein